jgi:hypothetical protein
MAALALGLVAILGAVLAGPIHRLGLLGARWSLGLFGVAALLGLVAAVLAAWGIALALLAHAWRSVVGSGLALLVAFMATAPLLIMVRTAAAVPVIHDITTDTENPPAWVALQSARAASENGTAYGGPFRRLTYLTLYPTARTTGAGVLCGVNLSTDSPTGRPIPVGVTAFAPGPGPTTL